MKYEELIKFLESRMRLSHIYQPLLIKALVDSGGLSTVRQLAATFLINDESQLLYYEKRLKEMPIKVLRKHGVISREGELISLNVPRLSLVQKAEIKKLCELKMQEYIAARGLGIWDDRMLEDSPVSDLIRYEVLKKAKGRCALCGATKDERPLDIDHIIPRSKGGSNNIENLQVLCSKCNRSKRNYDDADLRNLVKSSAETECVFCQKAKGAAKLFEDRYLFSVLDEYPVSKYHTLIIPKRHFSDFFDIAKVEHDAVFDYIRIRKKELEKQDASIQGFNIGVNAGEAAGQTIWHCHIHLIPRRKGDTENPRGGIRGVIPDKMSY